MMTKQISEEEGWPEDYIRAVLSHGWGMCTDVEPEHYMEKVLFATDELTGLITATALVRPTISILIKIAQSIPHQILAFVSDVSENIPELLLDYHKSIHKL